MAEYKFKYFRYPTRFEPFIPAEPTKVEDKVEVKEEVKEEPVIEEPVQTEEPVVEEVTKVVEEPVVEQTTNATLLEDAGFSATSVKNLAANDITTVEQLQAYLAEGKDLVDLDKIGKKSASTITEELEKYLAK